MSSLKPETSVVGGLAVATVVFAIYMQATPSIADIRVAPPQDANIESSRKMAAWTAAGTVAGIALITKDPTIFTIGGFMVIAMDWWTRHANEVNPLTGKASTAPSGMAPSAMPGDVKVEFAEGVGTY